MAVITAAAIGAVGAVGAAGLSYAASQQGGGGGGAPTFKNAPQDPLDRAMRSYYGRATLANATKTYPSFAAYASSGGDPALAKFDLDMPELTPQEATAFGFVGGHGGTPETIDYAGLASGDIKNLTPDQILYLAKQRAAISKQQGQPVGPWASRVLGTNRALGRVTGRLESLQAIEDPNRRQERHIARLTARQQRLTMRQGEQLHPDNPEDTSKWNR